MNRRDVIRAGLALPMSVMGASACAAAGVSAAPERPGEDPTPLNLRAAGARPVLLTERMPDRVILKSLEVRRRDDQYMIRAEDTDGAVGWALCNDQRFPVIWPIFLTRIVPAFEGKDMRDYERHLADAFVFESNYKWQGLALWSCFARAEIAILDLIGRKSGMPIYRLFGDPVRDRIGVYDANGNRKSSAERVIELLRRSVEESGARALKFKVGARMRTTEQSDARDRKLIPMVREAFGPEMTIYADANSSYDVGQAIEFGRLMEAHDFGFFEEPVRWDDLDGTLRVAKALSIPIAGGEQESSVRRFEWQIATGALQVVQPDLIYYGGLVRSLRVARMAATAGLQCVPHISGQGLGQLIVSHFAAIVPNTTEYQEYKGDNDTVPYELSAEGGRYRARDGELRLPTGPGLGVDFDPQWLESLHSVRL